MAPCENPLEHCARMIQAQGLTVDRGIWAGHLPDGTIVGIGDLRREGSVRGSVQGFDSSKIRGRLLAVVYDFAKAGTDDALKTLECFPPRPE